MFNLNQLLLVQIILPLSVWLLRQLLFLRNVILQKITLFVSEILFEFSGLSYYSVINVLYQYSDYCQASVYAASVGFISLLTCDSYIRIPPSFYFVNNFSKLFLLFFIFLFYPPYIVLLDILSTIYSIFQQSIFQII